MGGCRQTFSIWFYIKKVFKPYYKGYSRWKCFRELVRLCINKSRTYYFWHDSFGIYFNRFLVCRMVGHRNVTWLFDGGCGSEDRPKHYCFSCGSEVDPGVDKIKQSNEGRK